MPTAMEHRLEQTPAEELDPGCPPLALVAQAEAHAAAIEAGLRPRAGGLPSTLRGTAYGSRYVAGPHPEGGIESPMGVFEKTGPSPVPPPPFHDQTVFVGLRLVPGLNAREHPLARSRRVKRERELVAWALYAGRIPRQPIPHTVSITRIAAGVLDNDNLPGACKAVRDQIAAHFDFDDRLPTVHWEYHQRYAREPMVEIRISWSRS